MKPPILSVAHLPDFLSERLHERFEFHDRVHERDAAAFSSIAPRIRAIVTSSEAKVTRELLGRLPVVETQ
jgi:hypothetical protein